eukprot:scaffold205628_cov27-Prasinocladus_malaysianus.AAC.1
MDAWTSGKDGWKEGRNGLVNESVNESVNKRLSLFIHSLEDLTYLHPRKLQKGPNLCNNWAISQLFPDKSTVVCRSGGSDDRGCSGNDCWTRHHGWSD